MGQDIFVPIIITETFHPKNKSEWREWLKKYKNKKKEIWIVFYKKLTGKQTFTYKEALDEALCFGWIDGIEKGVDKEKYSIRFTPRSPKSSWSKNNITRFKELSVKGLVDKSGIKAFERKAHIK